MLQKSSPLRGSARPGLVAVRFTCQGSPGLPADTASGSPAARDRAHFQTQWTAVSRTRSRISSRTSTGRPHKTPLTPVPGCGSPHVSVPLSLVEDWISGFPRHAAPASASATGDVSSAFADRCLSIDRGGTRTRTYRPKWSVGLTDYHHPVEGAMSRIDG